MDDTLRPKHHINPSAQYDSHKVAAALSSSPQAQAKRQADCEEEDTLVMKRKEPDCCSSRKWSGESRRGKGDHWSKKREIGTLERELSGQQGCWRMNKGIEWDLEGAAREDRPMVILWRLGTDTSTQSAVCHWWFLISLVSILCCCLKSRNGAFSFGPICILNFNLNEAKWLSFICFRHQVPAVLSCQDHHPNAWFLV